MWFFNNKCSYLRAGENADLEVNAHRAAVRTNPQERKVTRCAPNSARAIDFQK
jgi:hypothetical protein